MFSESFMFCQQKKSKQEKRMKMHVMVEKMVPVCVYAALVAAKCSS